MCGGEISKVRVDVRSDEGGYKRVTALESKGMPSMLMSDREGDRWGLQT